MTITEKELRELSNNRKPDLILPQNDDLYQISIWIVESLFTIHDGDEIGAPNTHRTLVNGYTASEYVEYITNCKPDGNYDRTLQKEAVKQFMSKILEDAFEL